MTSTPEHTSVAERVVVPCRLIFWGTIICIPEFRLNGFDIINDFVGMIMILWGVVSLWRIPISVQYQRWMAFPVILAIFATIETFFTEILLLPNEIVSALFFLYGIISILGIIIFCRCMREYCSVMNWERAVASWTYSSRLITYGILLPSIILSIPLYLFVASLTFVPRQPHPPNGFHLNLGGGAATIDPSTAMIIVPLLLLAVVIVIWGIVHFLMSLSRTIRAARMPSSQQQNTTQEGTNRTVFLTLFCIAVLFVLAGSALFFSFASPRMEWNEESFSFNSGPTVYVFQQPKLVVFLGDGGDEEIFDRIGSRGSRTGSFSTGFGHHGSGSHRSGDVEVFASTSGFGKKTMWFLDRKHEMVLSERATKLTLADGRTFTLDGKTPLWLRCMSDGTVIELDELPEGFVQFFESTPDNPGMIGSIRSYPEAFRK